MASASQNVSVEKLSGIQNYNSWKFIMKMVLIHDDLWDCIGETENKCEDAKKQEKALAKIFLAVQPTVFPQIRNAKTAREAWQNLQKAYEDRGLCRRLGLLRTLFATKFSDCASMEAYVNRIMDTSQLLSDIGSALEDDFLAVILLSGLTSDYDPLIVALENSNVSLSSEVVKLKLLQENLRRDEKDENVTAFKAHKARKPIKCFKCKKIGHCMKDCPENSDGNKSGRKNTSLLTALAVGVQRDVWYVDSGSSLHLCNDRSVMSDFTSDKQKKVYIANGEAMMTAGKGTVQVVLKDNSIRPISNVYLVPKLTANLLSVSAMVNKGFKVVFRSGVCTVTDNGEVLTTATLRDGIYQLDAIETVSVLCSEPPSQAMCSSLSVDTGDSVTSAPQLKDEGRPVENFMQAKSPAAPRSQSTQHVWHRRLAHLNTRSMELLRKGLDRRKRVHRSLSDGRVIITQHFTERTVTPGGDISMQCSATGDRPPQFTWERDGVVVTTDARYSLGQLMTSDNSVVAQLNITRVRVEDGGLYSCIAAEGDHSAVHENRLDVYGPPYIRVLPPIKIQSGESISLRCPFYGYPISKIDWEYKGKSINSNPFQSRYKRNQKRKRNVPTVNINGILTLTEVSKEENGAVFTCIVTSPSGEMARRAFEIQVIEAPVLDDLLLGNNLQEGQIVNVYCNVRSGDLPIHFEWLKDGKRIPSGLKVVERSSELFSALVIKKVSLEHCGVYTCVASNHVAKVNRSTELYIKVAPKWLEEPSNSSLLLGRRGAVSCSASGYPQPQVHWMKKDALLGTWQPVLELAGGGILSLPNGTLIIEEVSLADEGLYSCNVENGVGQPLSKSVWMSVNKPVHFESSTTNVTSRLGHPVNLVCKPLGDDPIRVTWTHNGNVIDFRHHRSKLTETKSTLGVVSTINIQYSETMDAGLYQCRASNPFGAASFNIYLTILEPPTPPSDLRIESVSSRAALVSWRDAGRTHAQYYAIQHVPQHYNVWEHAAIINVTRKDPDLRQSLELQNLRPATAYGVRVATGNQVGVSLYTAPVHFTTHEEAPSSPPNNVQVEQTENPGELRASWMPPLKETHNGLIVGYHVKAVPQGGSSVSDNGDSRNVKVLHQTGKQETLLSGLLKNTRYAVSVSAFTSAGSGPFSIPVFQDTREGAPEQAPMAVECTAVSPTSLRVGWQPLAAGHGGSLVGYSVLYAAEEDAWHNQTSLHTEIYLQGLLKYSNYTVKVAGFSNFGAGPFSYPIVCATLQDVPDPPADIKVLVLSGSSLLVSWKKPEHPNGEILYYTVYVKPTSSNGPPQTHRVESALRSAEIKELGAGRGYEAWVTAATRAGEGAPTRRVSHSPSPRVVAGVASLGGTVSVGVGSSLLLVCQCVGVPPPRTVWYHKHNIITHHPRFTRNHDDSLLINNIDPSLGGNYTCLAKNLYGSDSVEYSVVVLPLPEAPILRATPHKHSILVEWEQPYYSHNKSSQKISYSLTWKVANGPWQEAWPAARPNLSLQKHLLTGLKCGTKYSVRITATNKVGTSQPAYLDVSTLGGAPIPPSSSEWVWSNSTHIYVQRAGWDDGACPLRAFDVQHRPLGSRAWRGTPNTQSYTELPSWNTYESSRSGSFAIGDLIPGTWYQVRVTAANEAGSVTTIYTYATKNEDGSEVGPPSEFLDLNMVVIICSSILLLICLISCIYILVRRQRSGNLTEYRDSITVDNKSESGNLTANTSHTNLANVANLTAAGKENAINAQNRIYSAPIHMRNNSKHELYEISPYAQFAVGFRTFGHVDNQDMPARHKHRFDTETSFQVCSESEDSDSISKSTLKSVPRKACRQPHHR